MRFRDLIRLALDSALRARMRSIMLLLAMSIGVAAVIALTSLGEGARRYVANEFQALGTRMIIVIPGRSETGGVSPGMLAGETPRALTLSDALAVQRLPGVERVAPLVVGSAPASAGALEREAPVMGSSAELMPVHGFKLARGEFLPSGDLSRDTAVAVIGNNIARELFPGREAIGGNLRIADRRFRVIGVLADQGRMIGMDSQELVIVPVSAAQALFNTESLFRLLIQAQTRDDMNRVREATIEAIRLRHQGEEDVTVITQDALLSTFDRIFTALTLTLAGIASISLAVAGVLIMNVMLVSVSQRTSEVGLLKAIGATRSQITALFLTEAILLSVAGAISGLFVGLGVDWIVGHLYPSLPLSPPVWAVVMALVVAIISGVVFGLMPARRAARLDPVAALAGRR
nr:ABC transporter permease [uncultured Steroidobacter sp.]